MSGETASAPLIGSDFRRETDTHIIRVLPPEEWATRADELLHYPYMPNPALTLLLVVEEKLTGRIVASWFAGNQITLEGLYLTEDVRGGFAVPKALLSGMVDLLTTIGVPGALTLAQEASILALARKVGFEPVPGTLLKLTL